MAKKENNRKNWQAREAWLKAKKASRPKQIWVWDTERIGYVLGIPGERGHWERVSE